MEIVTGYKCGFCHRVFGRKCDAVRHELSCSCNPARKRCKTCAHCYFKTYAKAVPKLTVESYMPWYSLTDEIEPEGGVWCGVHDVSIGEKPYNIECAYVDDDLSSDEYPIPGTCQYYEYKGNAKTQTEEEYKKQIAKESEDK